MYVVTSVTFKIVRTLWQNTYESDLHRLRHPRVKICTRWSSDKLKTNYKFKNDSASQPINTFACSCGASNCMFNSSDADFNASLTSFGTPAEQSSANHTKKMLLSAFGFQFAVHDTFHDPKNRTKSSSCSPFAALTQPCPFPSHEQHSIAQSSLLQQFCLFHGIGTVERCE